MPDTVKGRTLRRDQLAAMCIDDVRPPFSFVTVEGEVELSDDVDELLHWSTRIGGRYMGVDAADAYGRRNAVPVELLAQLRPQRIVSAKGVAL